MIYTFGVRDDGCGTKRRQMTVFCITGGARIPGERWAPDGRAGAQILVPKRKCDGDVRTKIRPALFSYRKRVAETATNGGRW